MSTSADWRIRNQKRYLQGVTLYLRQYEPLPGNDHDHCEFCFAKFMVGDYRDVLHEGYCTEDQNRWVCEKCFGDFASQFEWIVTDPAGFQS